MDLGLRGKKALVTGGTRGLGAAIAAGLFGEGVAVGIVGRSVPKDDPDVRFFEANLSDPSVAEGLIGRVWDEMGGLDILVNNAAVWPTAWFVEISSDQWRSTMDLNLTTPMILSREFARRCIGGNGEGVILNIVSQAAFIGASSGHADYAASKGALVNLTRTMARELARSGIRVNALAPGMMETKMAAEALAERREQYIKRIPLGRIADPAEVAAVAVFLCSPRAGYMTGATVDVSGGMLMH